jgi:hypothetical protein
VAFSSWLRSNSEHYLVVAAQAKIAERYGVTGPVRHGGFTEFFWLRIFVPMYRVMPWRLRQFIMRSMPGSHRRTWEYPSEASGPVI